MKLFLDLIIEIIRDAWELFRQHFDKLLLAGLFLYMTIVLLHMSHDSMDAQDISWAREQSNLIIGALLGLITGAVMRNGNKPTPPEAPKS